MQQVVTSIHGIESILSIFVGCVEGIETTLGAGRSVLRIPARPSGFFFSKTYSRV